MPLVAERWGSPSLSTESFHEENGPWVGSGTTGWAHLDKWEKSISVSMPFGRRRKQNSEFSVAEVEDKWATFTWQNELVWNAFPFLHNYNCLMKRRLKCWKAEERRKSKHIDNIQAEQSTHKWIIEYMWEIFLFLWKHAQIQPVLLWFRCVLAKMGLCQPFRSNRMQIYLWLSKTE